MSVGFAGLGNMGQGMVDNLLAKDADLTVFTRTQSKIEAMIARGAKGATSVVDLASKVDVVLVCLPDVKTSRDLLLGSGGVIANARTTARWILRRLVRAQKRLRPKVPTSSMHQYQVGPAAQRLAPWQSWLVETSQHSKLPTNTSQKWEPTSGTWARVAPERP